MNPEQSRYAPFYRMLIALASVAIIVAGIRAGSSIVGPFLLTFIIGLFAVPIELILVRRKVHSAIAFILVFGLVLLVMLLVMLGMSIAAAQFQASQVMHQEHIEARATELATLLENFGFTVTDPIVSSLTIEPFNAASVVVNEMLSALSDSFLVIMLVFFLLMDAPGLVTRLRSSVGYENALIQNLGRFIVRFLGSLYILTAMNLAQALYIFVFLVLVGVDFAALWAILSFLMLFVPIIGIFIAAAPAIFAAWLQFGWGMAALVLVGILVVPLLFQRFARTRFLPRTSNISLLFVFFAVVLTTWIFGLSGLLLAVPIVMTLQIIFETFPETSWIATLMGADSDLLEGTARIGPDTAR